MKLFKIITIPLFLGMMYTLPMHQDDWNTAITADYMDGNCSQVKIVTENGIQLEIEDFEDVAADYMDRQTPEAQHEIGSIIVNLLKEESKEDQDNLSEEISLARYLTPNMKKTFEDKRKSRDLFGPIDFNTMSVLKHYGQKQIDKLN